MRQMRKRVALGGAAIVGYSFVAAGEADRLEAQEADRLRIVERELDDSSDLLVVDAVHDRDHRNDFNSGLVQVFDRLQFHVEQVADQAMRIGCVADAVELQVGVAHAGFDSLLAEFKALGELDAVGRGLHGVVSDFAGVAHCVEEVGRQRGLAAGELHTHLPPRLDGDGVVEHRLDFFPGQFVDESHLVGVHEAGIAHHVAAVGQIDGEHRSAAVFHRRRSVMMQLLVVMRRDVASGEHFLQMLRERGVDRHHVFEVAVGRAVFHHQNLAVALDDLRLDLADLLVHQHFMRQVPVENLLPDFRHALGAQRIGRPRPAQRRLRLFVRLQQRLFRPLRRGRRIRLDAVQALEYCPSPLGGDDDCFFNVLDRLAHGSF